MGERAQWCSVDMDPDTIQCLQCGQVAARQMVAQNESGMSHGGAIINMSSVNAVMAIPTICSYNASKGGLNNLTRSFSPPPPSHTHTRTHTPDLRIPGGCSPCSLHPY